MCKYLLALITSTNPNKINEKGTLNNIIEVQEVDINESKLLEIKLEEANDLYETGKLGIIKSLSKEKNAILADNREAGTQVYVYIFEISKTNLSEFEMEIKKEKDKKPSEIDIYTHPYEETKSILDAS